MACLIIDNSKGDRSYVPHFLGESFNACDYSCCFILPFPNHHTGKHFKMQMLFYVNKCRDIEEILPYSNIELD